MEKQNRYMPENESPAESLRRRIAEERNGKFSALIPYRETIQAEFEISVPLRCIVRNIQADIQARIKRGEDVVSGPVNRYFLAQYLKHIGLSKRRNHHGESV